MKSHVQILTTPTADTPGTILLLHFDQKRYLIGNMCEGTQRACVQSGARLQKCQEIFMTGKTEWAYTGGLIGMILTLADSLKSAVMSQAENRAKKNARKSFNAPPTTGEQESTRLTLFGAPNLNHTLATARRFVFRKGMPVEVKEQKSADNVSNDSSALPPTWSDENILVWAMPIVPFENSKIRSPNGTLSPRKRSFAESEGFEPPPPSKSPEKYSQEEHDQIVQGVVSHMFDSNWRLDALIEMPLSHVRLPATIFVRDPETKQIRKYSGPLPTKTNEVPDIPVLVRTPWPGASVKKLPPTRPAEEAVSYIIRNHTQRGRFDPEKAKALKVPKGGWWARLAGGHNVQNTDGETVTPSMVLGEPKPGNGFAVVDLPSAEYVEPLLARKEWASKEVMDGIGAIIWILAPGVASHPSLRKFMEERSHIKHIVSSKDHCPNYLAMDSAASSSIRLGQIDPRRHEIPFFDNVSVPQAGSSTQGSRVEALPASAVAAQRGQIVQLQPSFELQQHQVVPFVDTLGVLQQASPQLLELARQARQDVVNDQGSLENWARTLPNPDAEIITLGTGSALPSKYRNVSATLLRVPGHGSYLFDCGENTLGQLKRVYAPSELQEVLKDLRMIWISHMHADHHLGTVSIIKAWYEAVHASKPTTIPIHIAFHNSTVSPPASPSTPAHLAVVSDVDMLDWLAEYSNIEDYGYSRIAPLAISSAIFTPDETVPSMLGWSHTSAPATGVSKSKYPALLGLEDIQAVAVHHCNGAKAVSLTFPSGFKASYSGDCRPSRSFARIGKGTTVLIHEATFDDELAGDAVAKQHSTTSEALGVGAAMGAKAVVLTHFSQRYQKIPVMEFDGGSELEKSLEDDTAAPGEDGGDAEMTGMNSANAPALPQDSSQGGAAAVVKVKSRDMKVCVAFDYMRVRVGEIAQLEKFTPALLELFAEPEKKKDAEIGQVGKGNAAAAPIIATA
ncbi:hypothetical protein H2201_002742 [Coniosporium apollinis]|uniref:ribonuclease Z n=1 Tax=Coniosporium apollinis TaxID=61459 RepID=A0ABQ9P1N9_9PEZI|nr:hypothetical protein H2201_002742 [Coniosporium apollinis]